MSEFLDRISKLSPKRLALLALEQHEQLEEANGKGSEPLAIVGMACRFPGGADDTGRYWDLLRDGREGIIEVPPARWDIDALYDPDPDAPGRMSVRNGGYLPEIGGFDPAFFGIAPREALSMDPQQRLLLEVTWEALEHAGIAPDSLAGSPTGVFVGICNTDHFNRVLGRGLDAIDAYLASGNAGSVASGRVAYFLGLHGPALSIDTACSSSLVALHVACRSLRSGETRLAIAAGVNLVCSFESGIALSKSHMLSPDGRCKAFDARADGFARGEGCGVLLLKRLRDALQDGDRVLALIRGTAVNQDGRSGGLTVPNGPAQEAVIRAALADGAVEPGEIDYVEAHGTGTSLGDPIEVRALNAALGTGRSASNPLLVGSVKTNFGHLEAAAGIAGVIKVVLSLMHDRIPAHLHFHTPSPHIPWQETAIRIVDQGGAWPRGDRPRRAGVSSFGFSGTNAHAILEEAPLPARDEPTANRPLHCLPLSARSGPALSQLARACAEYAAESGISLLDLAKTAGEGRSHLSERAAVVAASVDEATAALNALGHGQSHPALQRGTALPGQPTEVVFMFTGQGSQYPGMARELYASAPVFREVIDRCDAWLGADAQGRSLKSVLWTDETQQAVIHETAWTQPALFAVEYALAQLWRSWGVEPAAVIGHSVGEYVAACVAGVFEPEEGLRLIAERGRLMQSHSLPGSMAVLFASADEVAAALAPHADRVAIAAMNAPLSTVISGESDTVDALLEQFARRDVRGQRLMVSVAAHSPMVDPALDALEQRAAQVAMRAPRIPVAWNLTGGSALPGNAAPDARYWRNQMRAPVRFEAGIRRLHAQGYRAFLEIGPHPTLAALAQQSIDDAESEFVGSLQRGRSDWSELLVALSRLYVRGTQVNWSAVNGPYGGRRCDMPTYPFERQQYWLPAPPHGASSKQAAPIMGNALDAARLPTAAIIYQTTLTPESPAFLSEHRVLGAALVAGPVFLELAQRCAAQAFGVSRRAIEAFTILEPLILPAAGRIVELHFSSEDPPDFRIHSRRVDAEGPWRLHAMGRIVSTAAASQLLESLDAVRRRLGSSIPAAASYEALAQRGVALSGAFSSVREVHRADGESLTRVALESAAASLPMTWAHPALIDGALQSVGHALPQLASNNVLYLFTGFESATLDESVPDTLWCHTRLRPTAEDLPAEYLADVELRSAEGRSVGALHGICLRRASQESLHRAIDAAAADAGPTRAQSEDLYYDLRWRASPLAPSAATALVALSVSAGRLRDDFDQLQRQQGMGVYDQLLPELDRLCVDHILRAFEALGFDATLGRRFDAESEALRLNVVAQQRRLFRRLLDILGEEGVLARSASAAPAAYEVLAWRAAADPSARYTALLHRFESTAAELRILRRCAERLAEVLRGEQDPLTLLFPDGSLAEARALYVESPYARTYNPLLARALYSAVQSMPAGATLRVLEIGAGTGGTTSYVLPMLPPGRVDYTFTDVSPLFLERAAEQFREFAFVRYSTLDIERNPVEQGFECGRYDVVIAANVLHATRDLPRAVAHALQMLAPRGQLFLLEGLAPERWVDLTFGMTEGWWRFADGVRIDHPLIDREQWRALLRQQGCEEVLILPDSADLGRGCASQAMMVACAPQRHRPLVLIGSADHTMGIAARIRRRGRAVMQVATTDEQVPLPAHSDLVYLGALDVRTGNAPDVATVESTFAPVCARPLRWLAHVAQLGADNRMWFVTRGAQAVDGPGQPEHRWQAAVWGVGRVAALEQPDTWGGLIDLPPQASDEAVADALLDSVDAGDGEDQVAWRDGARFVARLVRTQPPTGPATRLSADVSYLVTGGLGGLGPHVARWLAQNGARHIALMSRNAAAGAPIVEELAARGVHVLPLAGDVADEASLRAALAQLAAQAPPLRGVVHAAADLSVAPIGELDDSRVRSMLRPKLCGVALLERLTQSLELDFLVLFSSTTALLGASGYAHYAAANAFLDATAHAFNRPGHRVLSVNWGTWEAMRGVSDADRRRYRESGLEPMTADEALRALGTLLAQPDCAQAAVAHIDWSVLKPLHELRRVRPLLAELGDAPPRRTYAQMKPAEAPGGTSLSERLAAAPESLRNEVLIEFVRAAVGAVLGVQDPERLTLDTGLFEMGMDSLMAVELRKRLERGAGRKLPSTLTFNYPSIGALAGFIGRAGEPQDRATPPEPRAVAPAPAPVPAPAPATDDLDTLTDEQLEERLLARLEAVR